MGVMIGTAHAQYALFYQIFDYLEKNINFQIFDAGIICQGRCSPVIVCVSKCSTTVV